MRTPAWALCRVPQFCTSTYCMDTQEASLRIFAHRHNLNITGITRIWGKVDLSPSDMRQIAESGVQVLLVEKWRFLATNNQHREEFRALCLQHGIIIQTLEEVEYEQ